MPTHTPADVPSPIDLRLPDDAREWASTALLKRPERPEFFAAFAAQIAASPMPSPRILELGSGPGFLAQQLLNAVPDIELVLLDFSPAMHDLARQRLGALSAKLRFVERSFRDPAWTTELGHFDFVLTHQAVHELRHKRHATALHRQVGTVLKENGVYLVCDHFAGEGGMSNDQLYMSVAEQRAALQAAGFDPVTSLLQRGSLLLQRAVKAVA